MQSVSSDVRWVDGGRPLFKFGLSLLSTIYTKVCSVALLFRVFSVCKIAVARGLIVCFVSTPAHCSCLARKYACELLMFM